MRFCDNCGATISDGQKICSKCGSYNSAKTNTNSSYNKTVERAFSNASLISVIRNIFLVAVIGSFVWSMILISSGKLDDATFFYGLTIFLALPAFIFALVSARFSMTKRSKRILKRTNKTSLIDKIPEDVYMFSVGSVNMDKEVIFQEKPHAVVIPLSEVRKVITTEYQSGYGTAILLALFNSLIMIIALWFSSVRKGEKRYSNNENTVRFFMKKGPYIDIIVNQDEFRRMIDDHPEMLPADIDKNEL